ncbi:acyl-CoA thioester hydrolase [Litoreibacter ponti]|uniref:Acyl-CoA thioester hydrolase n=1 Tax=Litoreibacter ponti TaxID=1510457 RepID=A0A2T6BJ29_9RHOB|nr:thioesterase family protein [Litoreibacter ponti]PTX56065.1 acyl-CoA thioester hydrolase [Litoreibacter ponti]
MTALPYHTPLDTPTLRGLGIPEPWGYGVADRTRFGELDALAHVSNVAYLRWFEAFRVHYLRDYGMTSYATADSPRMVLRRVEVDYLQEMKLSEDYITTGRTASVRRSSCVMNYAIWSQTLRATGSAVLVFLKNDGSKRPIPEDLRHAMITRDGAEEL